MGHLGQVEHKDFVGDGSSEDHRKIISIPGTYATWWRSASRQSEDPCSGLRCRWFLSGIGAMIRCPERTDSMRYHLRDSWSWNADAVSERPHTASPSVRPLPIDAGYADARNFPRYLWCASGCPSALPYPPADRSSHISSSSSGPGFLNDERSSFGSYSPCAEASKLSSSPSPPTSTEKWGSATGLLSVAATAGFLQLQAVAQDL